jgi:hypothetical protein
LTVTDEWNNLKEELKGWKQFLAFTKLLINFPSNNCRHCDDVGENKYRTW